MKSLAMRKMEKNFVAVIEKGCPRKPYEEFSMTFLLKRLAQEKRELEEALAKGDFEEAMDECADVSNIIDYIFEQLVSRSVLI